MGLRQVQGVGPVGHLQVLGLADGHAAARCHRCTAGRHAGGAWLGAGGMGHLCAVGVGGRLEGLDLVLWGE